MLRDVGHLVEILIAWAASASGPGWKNKFIHAIVRKEDGGLKEIYFQPKEWTSDMCALAEVSEVIATAMVRSVQEKLK